MAGVSVSEDGVMRLILGVPEKLTTVFSCCCLRRGRKLLGGRGQRRGPQEPLRQYAGEATFPQASPASQSLLPPWAELNMQAAGRQKRGMWASAPRSKRELRRVGLELRSDKLVIGISIEWE